MTEISLALALEDILLVAFFAVGLFFVGKMILSECGICGKLAFFGGFLVALGGFLKVSWKLLIALFQTDVAPFNNLLFAFQTAGFICLAWALWRSRKENNPTIYWLVPLLLITFILSFAAYFAFVKETRTWFAILLGTTVIFNLAFSFQLIFRAFQNKIRLAVGLFILNLICIFTLASIGDQTVTLQWIKQIIGTISQGSFAVAALLLYRSNDGLK
jgi:hypothetical protein